MKKRIIILTGNIIEFKRKGEDEAPPEKGNVLVDIKIRDDGSLHVWISKSVENEDEIDYLKQMAFNTLFTLGEILEERDDRYVEHTLGEKDYDDIEQDE